MTTATGAQASRAGRPWPVLHGRYLGLALFWACSMLTFRSSVLLSGPADTPEFNTLVTVVSFLANMTTLLSISTIVESNPDNLAKLPAWVFCALIVAGLACIGAAGIWFHDAALIAMLVAGSALAGVGYGYFWGSWADVLGRVHPSSTAFYAPAAFLLTATLFLAISLIVAVTPVPPLLLMAPLPALSLLCLLRCRADAGPAPSPRAGSRRYLTALGSLVPLIIAALVFSFLFGFAWETTVLSASSASQAHELPLVMNLVAAVVLLAFVVATRRRINLALAYQILIPISIVLFTAVPFFWDIQPVVFNAVMSAVYGIFDVIIWYLVSTTAYDFAVSGFVVGGLVRALSILARLVGIGIGYLIMLIPEVAGGALVGVCVGAVYLLVILLWFLWRSTRHPALRPQGTDDAERGAASPTSCGRCALNAQPPTDAEEASAVPSAATSAPSVGEAAEEGRSTDEAALNAAAAPDSTADAAPAVGTSKAASDSIEANGEPDDAGEEAVFALLAEDYGLTRREAEVLPYLAKGRSARVIAEALFVSESTIRTHTRRILEKTCLHSKQELIDLVDRY